MTAAAEDLRVERRIARIVIDGTENITVCELPCRNDFLVDLGVPGVLSRAVYRPRGQAEVVVAWSRAVHRVVWRRAGRPSQEFCDLCGDGWRTVIPAAVAAIDLRRQRWDALTPEERVSATTGLTPFTRARG